MFQRLSLEIVSNGHGFVLVSATRAGNIEAHKSQILTFLINFPQEKETTAAAAVHTTQ